MISRFAYLSRPSANFSLLNAAASAAGGGLLYGSGYGLSKMLQGDELTPEDVKDEAIANTVGGAVSGAGLYGLSALPDAVESIKPIEPTTITPTGLLNKIKNMRK